MAKSIGRTSILLVILMVFFLLLVSGASGAARVAIGPVQLQNAGIVEKVLPLVVAYLMYELITLTARHVPMRKVFDALARTYQPGLVVGGLHDLLWPSTTQLYKLGGGREDSGRGRIADAAATVMTYGLLLTPLVFEAFAYTKLFQRHGADDLIVWAALVLTLVTLGSAAATIAALAETSYHRRKIG